MILQSPSKLSTFTSILYMSISTTPVDINSIHHYQFMLTSFYVRLISSIQTYKWSYKVYAIINVITTCDYQVMMSYWLICLATTYIFGNNVYAFVCILIVNIDLPNTQDISDEATIAISPSEIELILSPSNKVWNVLHTHRSTITFKSLTP